MTTLPPRVELWTPAQIELVRSELAAAAAWDEIETTSLWVVGSYAFGPRTIPPRDLDLVGLRPGPRTVASSYVRDQISRVLGKKTDIWWAGSLLDAPAYCLTTKRWHGKGPGDVFPGTFAVVNDEWTWVAEKQRPVQGPFG